MSQQSKYLATGLNCGHCVHAVTEEVSAIAGVVEVRVDLNPAGASVVAVTSESPLDLSEVAAAIDEAGYEFAGAA